MPSDRIVRSRRQGENIEVRTIECLNLASDIDANWIDLPWDGGSKGATIRIGAILYN